MQRLLLLGEYKIPFTAANSSLLTFTKPAIHSFCSGHPVEVSNAKSTILLWVIWIPRFIVTVHTIFHSQFVFFWDSAQELRLSRTAWTAPMVNNFFYLLFSPKCCNDSDRWKSSRVSQLEKFDNHINVLLLIFDSGEVFQEETLSDLVI